ncbi:MAG: oligosaccharide flippase family protein [Candidatus Daviesbacteria bacterium]|nr:oligosaccharide flippase family protein [Candidatus Daviesbacteria bacterium]
MYKLKSLVLRLFKHQLLAGSLVMIIGSNVYNLTQLIYHFVAGRFLGKVYYGDLAAIISILGLISIVQLAVNLTIVKQVASEGNLTKKAAFIKWVWSKSILLGFLIMVVATVTAPFLASFLNLSQKESLFLLGPILFGFIVLATGRAVLQGLASFDKYVVTLIVEGIIKLAIAIILLYLGFSVFGALVGFLIGVILAVVLIRFFIREFLDRKTEEKPEVRHLFGYSIAAFSQGLALTSMYTTDLLLVKHFFSAELAGIYASLAILGRVVFFGASPVTSVMFPLIAKRHQDGQSYHIILYLSAVIIMFLGALITLFYYFAPNLAIGVLYGKSFLEGAELLWWYAVFMSLLSLAMLFTQFYLSIARVKVVYLFFVAAILQIILISIFHGSLLSVIQVSIISVALLDFALLVYFPYHSK